jgi:hypothetical protein
MVLGEQIFIDRNADEAALTKARRAVEDGLDQVHERAYALLGARDPGAQVRSRQRASQGSPA